MEGMTHTYVSTAAASAREAARTAAGQFGTQARSEAEFDLVPTPSEPFADPKVWTRADDAELAAIAASLRNRHHLDWEMDQCQTVAGKRLIMRALGDRTHPTRNNVADAAPKPEQADALAALGYQDKEDFTDAANLGAARPYEIIEMQLTPARAAGLRAAGFTTIKYPNAPWLRDTLRVAPVPAITAAMGQPDEQERWAALVGLTDPARGERAREFFVAGERDLHWIQSGFPLSDLQAMRTTLDATSDSQFGNERDAETYVRKGLTPVQVSSYGPKVCWHRSKEEIDDWDTSGHSPAVLKSLHHRASHRNVASLRAFADAGITRGADLAVYENRLGYEMGGVEHTIAISKMLSPTQLKTWADEQGKGYRLSRAEVEGVVKLTAADYDNLTEAASEYKGSFYGPASLTDDSMLKAANLAVMGDIVASGATPAQARAMTRAGIPPTKIPELLGARDYWAAGQHYRDAYVARQSEQSAQDGFVGTGTGTGGLFDTGAVQWPIEEDAYRASL